MIRPSEAIARLSRSERANKLNRPDADVISLASGDPSFDTPDYIQDAAIAAMRQGRTHYSSPVGEADLREVIAARLSEQGGGTFSSADILVTAGAASGIYASMVAYLDPGDEVLIHDPSYSLYADAALSIGAVPVLVPWTADFRLDMEALERLVGPRARVFILNNPVNPTGTVFRASEMQEVVQFVIRHDLLLLADEAYDHLVYDGRPMISAARFAELADRLIVINTCSKTFAMTGWRVGYAAGRNGLIRAPAIMHRTATGFVNTIAQRAALTAFSTRTNWQGHMLDEYARRRALMCSMVNAIPELHCDAPEGAFYVFARVEAKVTSEALAEHCLRHGVAVRSGTEFGQRGEGFIRLTFAGPPARFEPGLERLARAMRSV